MRITDKKNSPWENKVNFIDSNDVFVGYDLTQNCCENAGWFISKEIEYSEYYKKGFSGDTVFSEIEKDVNKDVSGYVFDVSEIIEYTDPRYGGNSIVVFKMICDNKDPLYLHLFNCHNGYYSHGFECTVRGETFKEGRL